MLYAKIKISGILEVVTGLHIGGSDVFAPIGAVDSPVIKDALSGSLMIPGSSLKGKLRTLLAKRYNQTLNQKPENDDERLQRLFGSSKKERIRAGKVIFSDMLLNNWQALQRMGAESKTEIKFENTIDRLTSEANPRQIERVIRGSEFLLDIIYEAYGETTEQTEQQMVEDFEVLAEGFRLLQYDYLGGSGTRGYGKVRFRGLKAETVSGELKAEVLAKCGEFLSKVEGAETEQTAKI